MSVFKAYDIRGLYPKELTEDLVHRIGRAFVRLTGAKRIAMGRDMRPSSPVLSEAIAKGMAEEGAAVFDIGMSSTPMLYFAVAHYNYDAGVIVTASHNQSKYNGFKFCLKDDVPFTYEAGISRLEGMVKQEHLHALHAGRNGRIVEKNVFEDYIKYLLSRADIKRLLKIVIDCGNGISGPVIERLVQAVPVDADVMYAEPDGSFPNHVPNPADPENMRDLQAQVLKAKADVGFALDGDADRLGVVDEKGRIVSPDMIIALISTRVLKEKKGAEILFDLRSSRAVKEAIEKAGGVPVPSRVGHTYIQEEMRAQKMPFGGELSGHYYFKENQYTDSGPLAMVYLLNLLSKEKKPVSELVKPFQRYCQSNEINIPIGDRDADEIISRLEAMHKKGRASHLDGLKVEYEDWWFIVRPSHTEPVIRLRIEADTRERLEEVQQKLLEEIRDVMNKT